MKPSVHYSNFNGYYTQAMLYQCLYRSDFLIIQKNRTGNRIADGRCSFDQFYMGRNWIGHICHGQASWRFFGAYNAIRPIRSSRQIPSNFGNMSALQCVMQGLRTAIYCPGDRIHREYSLYSLYFPAHRKPNRCYKAAAVKAILYFALACFVLATSCSAYSSEDITKAFGTEDIQNAVPENAKEYMNDIEITDALNFNELWLKLKEASIELILNSLDSLRQPFLSFLILIMIATLLDTLLPGNKGYLSTLFVSTQILILAASETKSFFSMAVDAIQQLYDFSTVLLPCLTAASLAAGASVSAGVKYTAAALFMNILLNFTNLLLVPVISAYLVMISGGCIFQQRLLSTLASLLKKGCKWILTGGTILFTGYLNVAGLISSTNDLLASKVTKTVIASTLPVIGNIISNASDSLVAGASLLRNCIGIFGMVAVIGTLIAPFISLGIRYVLFSVLSLLAELFPNKTVSELIKGIAGAYSMMLSTLGMGFILIFMTLISFMQVTGGAI